MNPVGSITGAADQLLTTTGEATVGAEEREVGEEKILNSVGVAADISEAGDSEEAGSRTTKTMAAEKLLNTR